LNGARAATIRGSLTALLFPCPSWPEEPSPHVRTLPSSATDERTKRGQWMVVSGDFARERGTVSALTRECHKVLATTDDLLDAQRVVEVGRDDALAPRNELEAMLFESEPVLPDAQLLLLALWCVCVCELVLLVGVSPADDPGQAIHAGVGFEKHRHSLLFSTNNKMILLMISSDLLISFGCWR